MNPTETLRVLTLGHLVIEKEGVPVEGFISRKSQLLFVFLACHPEKHAREVIADLLWQEGNQSAVQNNLSKAITNLRQLLPDYLEITRYTIGLVPQAAIWIDAFEFEQKTQELEQYYNDYGYFSQSRVQFAEQVLKLYQGDFLEGIHLRNSDDFEEWKITRQSYLRRLVVNLQYCLAQSHLDWGEYGEGIRWASRLLQQDPLSEETIQLLMKLLAGYGQQPQALKTYEAFQRRVEAELGTQPIAETQTLYEQIKTRTYQLPAPRTIVHNLPVPLTIFIHREREEAAITAWMERPHERLLTLVGMGGSGKTRLALHHAALHLREFPDGVYFVSLIEVESPHLIALKVALDIGLSASNQEDLLAQIAQHFQTKNALLILDNFEQLKAGAPVINKLLTCTRRLKILVTSRERLGLLEEHILTVGGMQFPEASNGNHGTAEAVALFYAHARRINADFSLKANAQTIGEICRYVQGLPLAVELSAQWTRSLACAQIAQYLESHLEMLVDGNHVPDSAGTSFERSWQLLNADEQRGLMALAVFRSSFTLETAADVAGANTLVVTALVEKSLVHVDSPGRYKLHPLIRHFGLQKAQKRLEIIEQAERAHYHHFCEFAVALGKEPNEVNWHRRADIEEENLRQALEAAIKYDDCEAQLRLAHVVVLSYSSRGYLHEAQYWSNQILRNHNLPETSAYGRFLFQAGLAEIRLGNMARAKERYECALNVFRKVNDQHGIAQSLIILSTFHDPVSPQHEELLLEGLSIARSTNKAQTVAQALNNLGACAYHKGDIAKAENYILEALEWNRLAGSPRGVALNYHNLSEFARQRQNYELAVSYHQEALALARKMKLMDLELQSLLVVTAIAVELNKLNEAVAQCEAILEMAKQHGYKQYHAQGLELMGKIKLQSRDSVQARPYFMNALNLFQELGHTGDCLSCLVYLGLIMAQSGQGAEAITLLGSVEAKVLDGIRLEVPEAKEMQSLKADLMAALSPQEFEARWKEGQNMTLEQTLLYLAQL